MAEADNLEEANDAVVTPPKRPVKDLLAEAFGRAVDSPWAALLSLASQV